jgi:hypothetical protein
MKFYFDFKFPSVDSLDFYLKMPTFLFKIQLGTSTVPTYLTFHKTQGNYCICYIHGPYAPMYKWHLYREEEFDLVPYNGLLWKVKFDVEDFTNYFVLEPV